MNQFFSFKRFSLLVLKHWTDNKKRYSLTVLAYFGLLILWFLFGMLISKNYFVPRDVQFATFFLSLFAVGTFYASQYFRDLSSRARGSYFLLVPASTFEKFLCSLLFAVVLFSFLFTGAFYLADLLMVSIANSISEGTPEFDKTPVVNVFNVPFIKFNDDVAINFFLLFFSVQSLFLFGSVYFKKYNFIKTIISCFVIFLLFFLLFYIIHVKLLTNKPDDYLLTQEKWLPYFLQVMAYSAAPVFWVLTYFQLKAKQV